MQIITPKTFVDLEHTRLPLFFLAGPIKGGGDWQQRMCRAIDIAMQQRDCYIAVPNSWDASHPLAASFAKPDNVFPHQLDFERYYIDRALAYPHRGCLVFWLGEQKQIRPAEYGPYGRDTLAELGEARGRLMHNPRFRLAVGGEEKFSGLDVIQRNFDAALKHPFMIHKTMEDTAAAAVRLVTMP